MSASYLIVIGPVKVGDDLKSFPYSYLSSLTRNVKIRQNLVTSVGLGTTREKRKWWSQIVQLPFRHGTAPPVYEEKNATQDATAPSEGATKTTGTAELMIKFDVAQNLCEDLILRIKQINDPETALKI